MGVQVLVNDSVEVGSGAQAIRVIGVDDPHYYGCDDLAAALADVPADAFKVLLAHSPEMYEEAAQAGIHLYLCGHTHAGQIRLRVPFTGRLFAPLKNADCPREYADGAWRHRTMQGYTSAGLGSSLLPVRYNCPPEIVIIELRRSASK
jgi:predicted MPP superfamily phosphohydrolase